MSLGGGNATARFHQGDCRVSYGVSSTRHDLYRLSCLTHEGTSVAAQVTSAAVMKCLIISLFRLEGGAGLIARHSNSLSVQLMR